MQNNNENRAPILILGIGNILMQDEGIGPHAIHELQKLKDSSAQIESVDWNSVDIVDGGTAGADLIDILADREKVIVVDTIDAEEGTPPGTILKVTPDQLAAPDTHLSLHEIGLTETLHMLTHLKSHPRTTIIFGIVPETIAPNFDLSPTLKGILPKLTQIVLSEACL